MITTNKQGNGFNHDLNLSNNAVAAQANGLIAGSTNLKKALIAAGIKGIPLRFLTAHAPSCEYHHHGMAVAGGKYIRAVNYYDLNEVIEWLSLPDTQAAIATFKSNIKVSDSISYALIEWKEYRTQGSYGSTSGHLVRAIASIEDSGSQWTITILSSKLSQRMFWQKSRYGRGSDVYVPCSWYKVGDLFRKSKDNVELIKSMTTEEISELIKNEKREAALQKRRNTIRAKKEAAEQAALKAAQEKARAQAFELLNEMEPQFLASGADYSRKSCAWFIYSMFFEGQQSRPNYITCGMINNWIKSKKS